MRRVKEKQKSGALRLGQNLSYLGSVPSEINCTKRAKLDHQVPLKAASGRIYADLPNSVEKRR
jgi:hypothetical protein